MNTTTAIDLLFGGMEQLGPGGNAYSLRVLRSLPNRQFRTIVDAGCGTGRQTIALATELNTRVHAVDTHQPFLDELARRAKEANVAHLIQLHCLDMKRIPLQFDAVDLLWSEGAAYNIGFSNALETWATAIKPNGLAVVSELSWLREQVPRLVEDFFAAGYPDMQLVSKNIDVAESAGFKVLDTYRLPKEAWVEGYYDILEPRARELVNHADSSVSELAAETVREIEIFNSAEDSYGYIFYVLQRA